VQYHNAYFEAGLASDERQPTSDLYHYTSADGALFGILQSGNMRLSPFEFTNDLWESRPLYPTLTSHFDDQSISPDHSFALWKEIDRNIRLHSKVACLTRDWDLPDHMLNRDALRGWAHLSLWAHYGARHAGVCLRFDKTELIRAFEQSGEPGAHLFHGAVTYVGAAGGAGSDEIDIGQVKEFGVDAVAAAYAVSNKDSIFLRKHSDWSNEYEYRFVLMDQSVLPATFSIRNALTGVFLGDAFPQGRLPALYAALGAYPNVAIYQLRFHNRTFVPFPPVEPVVADDPMPDWAGPRRGGSVTERIQALGIAEELANTQRRAGESATSELRLELKTLVDTTATVASALANVEVATYPSITAVPEAQRSRAPGVRGERVHFEQGHMCVVESLPKPSFTLVASVAVQVLDDRQLRFHAAVTLEVWRPEGVERAELWRTARESPLADGRSALAAVSPVFTSAANSAFSDFDGRRGVGD